MTALRWQQTLLLVSGPVLALLACSSTGTGDGSTLDDSDRRRPGVRSPKTDTTTPPDSDAQVVCEVGALRCVDAVMELCRPDQQGYEALKSCPSAVSCAQRTAEECGCESDEERCLGAEAQRCKGGRWETLDTCESATACQATHADCNRCEPGQRRCFGTMAQLCNSSSTWVTEATCESAQLCNAQRASCYPAATCTPGVTRCDSCALYNGNSANDCLFVCNQEGSGYVFDEVCGPGQPESCVGQPARCL